MSAKRINILLLVVILVVCCCLLLPALYLGGVFAPILDYSQSEKYLQDNQKFLCIVYDYMISLPTDSAMCKKSSGDNMIFTGPNTSWHSIENDEAVQALKYLFNETSCTMVTKKGKTVAFTLWSKNMNIGGGVVCSESSIDIEFLTKLQPLSMPTWYYYVSDFNAYRISKT